MSNLKKVLALVLVLALSLTMFAGAIETVLPYDDVDELTAEQLDALKLLYALGVIKGDGEDSVNPTDTLTRAELSAILYRLYTGDAEEKYVSTYSTDCPYFDDVEDGKWYAADTRYYDPYAVLINPNFIDRLPEFKYSAYKLFQGCDIFKYLRLYRQYPQIEMLMKLGFTSIAMSATILKRCGTDKAFCKWLISNKALLQSRHYYIDVIVRAYKTKKSLEQLQSYKEAKLRLIHDSSLAPIKELFKGKDLERFFDYMLKQQTNQNTYLDYLKACQNLGLDMTEDKNRFPHDFKRWHDIRIDQYATKKAIEDEEKHKELYIQFAAVAEKYLSLQHAKRSAFVCIIAKSPADLIREGEALHHCVGRMNYEQRMVREESLIFFIRNKQEPNTPFVTVEYSISQKKVLQCYGEHDHKPNEDVLHYVNKVWLPYANRTLKQIAA